MARADCSNSWARITSSKGQAQTAGQQQHACCIGLRRACELQTGASSSTFPTKLHSLRGLMKHSSPVFSHWASKLQGAD